MSFFDATLINIILVVFPFLLYFIYLVYNYEFNKKANELILDLSIITSYYFVSKYQNNINPEYPFFLLSVPLFISYSKKRNVSIFLLFFLPLFAINDQEYLIIFVVEKILTYVSYLLIKDSKKFNMLFWIIRILSIISYFLIANKTFFSMENMIKSVLFALLGIFVSIFIVSLFKKTDNLINIYMNLNDLKKESQIKNSLFQITHEIKNPIAVCKGYLDMFSKDKSDKYIPIIKSEIDRTLILMQDFLSLNKLKIDKDLMDITMLLDETIDEMSLYGKITINKNYDEEFYVDGDYNRLKQVLVNIFKNSIEATLGDGIIDVSIKNDVLIIKDNGQGMSPETLKKIKEPFFTTKIHGTGLGVPLMYEIIEAHDWKIDYESILDEGTTVKIFMKKSKII
jgi:two-component system, sporulation sensor kinase B